ncbi:MAG TPA: hypothetical protein VIU65_12215 [Pyrinomonadaceae bacterium]
MLIRLITFLIVALLSSAVIFAQDKRAVPVCRQASAAALRPLPKMDYECPEGVNDYVESILKLPARLAAIQDVIKELQGFTDPAWWRVTVDELNACEVHGGAGELTDDEKQRWRTGDVAINLIGNQQMRLVIIADPCYQAGFGGSNAFLLYRNRTGVTISQVLNGYYSRVDNSVGIGFANLGAEQIIEISTANSMPPSLVSYFFVIDAKTNQAVPKNIFKEGRKLTNQISSAMLLGDLKTPPELKINGRQTLNSTFSVYHDSERGTIDDSGRTLQRIVYRWNGRFYTPVQNGLR